MIKKISETFLILLSLIFLCHCAKPGSSDGGTVDDPYHIPTTTTKKKGTTTTTVSAAETYFSNTIVPLFTNKCSSCHNDPRFNTPGDNQIYNYDKMWTQLRTGGADNNQLMLKLRAQITHTGTGDRCAGSNDNSPCSEVKTWWAMEALENGSPSGTNSLPIGQISGISPDGTVSGYALDLDQQSQVLSVQFYIGGQKGVGTLIGTAQANGNGGTVVSQGHTFAFSIPATYRDKTAHQLYAYVPDATVSTSGANLPGGGLNVLLYPATAAGMNYYNNTVVGAMSSCVGCHKGTPMFTYNTALYNYLYNLPPNSGGTATNNLLINKPLQNVSHSGGPVCKSASASPCAEFQQWWHMETGL